MVNEQDLEGWWDKHPLLTKFYVPLVVTSTFVVTIIDVLTKSRGQ